MRAILVAGVLGLFAMFVPAPPLVNTAEAQVNPYRARACWTYNNCATKCRRNWKVAGYASPGACIANYPCSQYPRSC